MNKQEAIKVMKEIKDEMYLGFTTEYEDGYNEGLDTAITYIEKLIDPEKPVVPRFVADWLAFCKENLAISLADSMNPNVLRTNNQPEKTIHWLAKNQETFAKAWIYGYEVEKEKVYRARHKLTGEYLSQNYTKTGYYHGLDHFHMLKLSKKDWEELGVLNDKMYEIEEVEE